MAAESVQPGEILLQETYTVLSNVLLHIIDHEIYFGSVNCEAKFNSAVHYPDRSWLMNEVSYKIIDVIRWNYVLSFFKSVFNYIIDIDHVGSTTCTNGCMNQTLRSVYSSLQYWL